MTIIDYQPESREYKLGYPNLEVDESFNKIIVEALSNTDSAAVSSLATKIYHALNNRDLNKFMDIVLTQ